MEIYFDNAATTPILHEVRAALLETLSVYGNPSSLHGKGVEAERALSEARAAVLRAAGRKRGRVVFTGGGTEANNLAIVGTIRRFANRGKHLVTTRIEHPSVLETYRALEQDGWSVTYVAPRADGMVTSDSVLAAVTSDTVLVSVMHVNNETGALQPVDIIGEELRKYPKTLFHVDGIQAFGKIPDCLSEKRIDLYSVSGHKLGAPKGIGALVVREGLEIGPLLYGGGQEFGLRSGTENIPGIVAFAKAAELAIRDIHDSFAHVTRLRVRMIEHLSKLMGARIHSPEVASPYVLSVSFPGLRGEVMVHALEMEGVYVSTGSACSTRGGHSKESHVLSSMGCNKEEITGTLRFSFGRWNTVEEVDAAGDIVKRKIEWLYEVGGRTR